MGWFRGSEMWQAAPFPDVLAEIVASTVYRPNWRTELRHVDRGQGSQGLTLVIRTQGFDSYHVDRGETYGVLHYFPVPPAAYNRVSWQRWLFECFLLVERHEAAEFFVVDGVRPYAPHHGPGFDPYQIFEHGSALDAATSSRGEVNP